VTQAHFVLLFLLKPLQVARWQRSRKMCAAVFA